LRIVLVGVVSGVATGPCVDEGEDVKAVSLEDVRARGGEKGESLGSLGEEPAWDGGEVGLITGDAGFITGVPFAEPLRDAWAEDSFRGEPGLGGEGIFGGVRILGGEYVRGDPRV